MTCKGCGLPDWLAMDPLLVSGHFCHISGVVTFPMPQCGAGRPVCPSLERAPLMVVMEDLSREKQRCQHN